MLTHPSGLSVLFLIIAMLLLVTMGTLLSYLIPVKQKSVRFPIYSNQAFFIAQSGVEYGVRYGSDQGWRSTAMLLRLNNGAVRQRNLGNGRFTISYDSATDALTSTGEITNAGERRVVKVSNVTQFLRLVFDPASPAPCWSTGTSVARFFVKNVRNTDVTVTGFSVLWTQGTPARRIQRITIDGVQKYQGNYSSGGGMASFNRGGNRQTISPDQVITVLVQWNDNVVNGADILFTFTTAAGDGFAFNLDPEGDGLPAC